MKYSSVCLIIAVIFMISCDRFSQNVDSTPIYPMVFSEDPENFDRSDWDIGRYLILSSEIENDVLILRVNMAEAVNSTIKLVVWNYWLETYPVQVFTLISYKEANGGSQILKEKVLRFELTPLREQYVIVYPGWGTSSPNRIRIGFVDPLYPQPKNSGIEYIF